MRNIYILICFILLSSLNAQESYLKYCNFNAPYSEVYDIKIIKDEIFGTGFGWDTTIIPPKQLFYIFKADIQGDVLDYKFYRNEDTSMYAPYANGPLYFPCLLTLDSSNFVVVFFNLTKGLEIFKFDTTLEIINKNSVPSSHQNTGICPIKMFKLNNYIYLVGYENFAPNKYQSYLFKYDLELKLISKVIVPNIDRIRSFGYNIQKNEFIFSEFNQGDKYVITDTLFNKKKSIKLSDGLTDVYHENLVISKDENFLTSSYNLSGSPDFTLNIVKRDDNFNTLWKFNMGAIPGAGASVVNVVSSSDGAYFAYGQVGARVADIRDIYSSLDSIDIMMLSSIKFKDDGRILWQRFDTLEIGYYNVSYAKSGGMVAASDGGLYVSGDVTWYDTIRVDGILKRRTDYKHFLMKIDSNGCVDGLHCNVEPKTETVLSVQPPLSTDGWKLSVYPNPSTGIVTVDLGMDAVVLGLLTIYNAQGKSIHSQKLHNDQRTLQLDLSDQTSGRYYIIMSCNDGKMLKGSFMLIK
mgnify:CR=1 FL=1|jgi:hypothetical protein